MRKRMRLMLIVFGIGICVLVGSLVNITILHHEEYYEAAVNQQTKNTVLAPQRGSITDRNGTKLAESTSARDVSIDAKALDDWEKKYPKDRYPKMVHTDDICRFLADTLGMTYDEVYNLATATNAAGNFKRSQYLKKKVDMETADKISAFVNENGVNCLKLDETSKRSYPFGNFAAHILGYVGADNQGQAGIEAEYDEVLRGTAGSIVSARVGNKELPYDYDKYVEAQDGANVVLTIDEVIQHYLEKYLREAKSELKLQGKATGIMMDVNTGAVLAMAVIDDYDPNDPYAIPDEVRAESTELPEEEQNTFLSNYLQSIWRNFAVSDTYEPGSVYKPVTVAGALEEGVVSESSTFWCGGKRSVTFSDGTVSGCWRAIGHGTETLQQALENSCNPALMKISTAMGRTLFHKYQLAFGYGEKTGIDIVGEANSQLYTESQLNEVELAICSFGQTFKVTPIQMITAISAIANGGYLYEPYLVKETQDSEGHVITSHSPVLRRQVISEETSAKMVAMMESVVGGGPTVSGKNAYITGYRVAGKTGTSEKRDTPDEGDVIASFCGFAPANDPQVACLIILDDPPDHNNDSGGGIAAPVFRKVMSDTLSYLKIEPQYTQDEMNEISVQIVDVVGKSVSEAKATVSDANFNTEVIGNGDTVLNQVPKAGASMPYGSTIYLFTSDEELSRSVVVPNVVGMTPSQANQTLKNAGLNVKLSGPTDGTAKVTSQAPAADKEVDVATLVTVELASNTDVGD